jgi:hypothetical protein
MRFCNIEVYALKQPSDFVITFRPTYIETVGGSIRGLLLEFYEVLGVLFDYNYSIIVPYVRISTNPQSIRYFGDPEPIKTNFY